MSRGAETDDHILSSTKAILREDDQLIRHTFFDILKKHEPDIASQVDEIYDLSKSWCDEGSSNDIEKLSNYIEQLKPTNRVMVASCFSHSLNLHNLTEEGLNVIEESNNGLDEVDSILRRTGKSMSDLEMRDGLKPEEIYHALCSQSVDLVFTAHPTQALRREIVSTYRKMKSTLSLVHHAKPGTYERDEGLELLKGFIQTAWRTDEIHRTKPTPQDEMRAGLASFVDVIFPTLPSFLKKLDACLAKVGQPRIPFDHALFKFGSWMGGDRDGNPNVTHDTTRDVCIISRITACDLYFKEIEKLMLEISVWRVDEVLRERVEAMVENTDHIEVAAERKRRNYADFWNPIPKEEPFRVILADLRDKLYHTREILHTCLPRPSISLKDALEGDNCISYLSDLTEPLLLMYRSLINTGDTFVANGHLLDLIRQIYAFGLGVVQLDVRQESARHSEVINCITQYLDIGSYHEWNEEQRLEFLLRELKGRRPLLAPSMPKSEDIEEVLLTFRTLASLPSDSLGAYIISMAKSASDVLAIVLLQRECGIKSFMRVVPLFETLSDLDNAPSIMHRLFSDPWYRSVIQGKQECMIGYSDSGKDAGRLAAAWALYKVQLKLVAIAEEFGIQLVLFHGRGGTVGRGGGPTHIAIKSQPPGTIKGCMRVTIQGEIISQQFGEREVCSRTLDFYASAVLDATLAKINNEPKTEWTQLLTQMAEVSCKAYRSIVFEDPNFVTYFTQITPVAELAKLNIGSRPASRKKSGGVETLRAIPWIFAWNQARLLLPVWLGLGEAIEKAFEAGRQETLVEMYSSWNFFKATIDLVEMVMHKADPKVVKMYDSKLVDASLKGHGEDLMQRFAKTKSLLSSVTGHGSLGLGAISASPLLSQKLKLRSYYTTPLNMLQIECLKDLRAMNLANGNTSTTDATTYRNIEDALIITIKGIAAGMQNTG